MVDARDNVLVGENTRGKSGGPKKPWVIPVAIAVPLGVIIIGLVVGLIVVITSSTGNEKPQENEEPQEYEFRYHANFGYVTVVDGVERITYDDLPQFTYDNVLIIPKSVKTIDRDALLPMLNLEAIVIDTRSPAKPENCDYPHFMKTKITEDSYSDEFKLNNITIFRTSLDPPPKFILPSNEFAEGYEIPFIQYSGVEKEVIEIYLVDDTLTLVESIEPEIGGFELHKVTLDVGKYQFKCGTYEENLKVVSWNKENIGSEIDEDGVLNIPYGVNSIEDGECIGCERLKKVIIPSSLKVLDTNCFWGNVLEEVHIDNGIKVISNNVLAETNLTEVDIPESVSILQYDPFRNTPSLKTIKVNNELFRVTDNNELIDTRKMGLIHYICPDTQDSVYTVSPEIRNIGMYSINGCTNIKKIVFHEEIDNIETYSVNYCDGLTSVILPNGMKRIDGIGIFAGCGKLESLTIPPSLWTVDGSISRHAFMDSSITTICLDNTGTDEDCSNMKEKVMLWFDGSDEEVDIEVKCGGCHEEQ